MSAIKSKRAKVIPQIVLLIGTSCAGKTTLVQGHILPNFPDVKYVSADEVFKDLKVEFPRTPYASLKLLVPARLQQKVLERSKTNQVLVDDIKLDLLDSGLQGLHSILIFVSLKELARNATLRRGGDRRPLDSVLRSFTSIYTTKPGNGRGGPLGEVSRKDIAAFLDLDKTLAAGVKEKALVSACKAMGLGKKGDAAAFFPRKPFHTIIDANGKSQAEVFDTVKQFFV
jgi:hypothetical protein